MMRLFVCICYDYICGLVVICICMMMTFVFAKDSCIKPVQIQNKYAKKTNKIRSSEWRKVSSSVPLAVAQPRERCTYTPAPVEVVRPDL